MDLGLKGKRAMIAAASRGLGQAAGSALAAEGTDAAICSRSMKIFDTAREIQPRVEERVFAYQADITKTAEINGFTTQAAKDMGGNDILIIHAGGPPPGGFLDLSPQDWLAAIDLTLLSAIHLCNAVVAKLLEQGCGSIVAAQSYSIKQPIDNLLLSNTLRLGVIGLMKSLANELGSKGIRVNTLNLAWTWTEREAQLMQDRAERSGASIEEQSARIAVELPSGRMGTVDEFGSTIAWLASPAASFIHGHALMFDGGAVRTPL
jgi:3-oxoacyl-[acyl-carrier protein] reductase